AQLVLQEVEAHLRGDDLLQLDRNGVGRALDRDIDGDIAQVGTIEVHRPGTLYTVFCDGNGGILYQRGEMNDVIFHSQRIGCDRLDGRTGVTHRVTGTVEGTGTGLGAVGTGNGLDLT